ncbi:putative outer capsid protein [Vibrio phage vB_VpaP_G1]|uniref:Outer capsid protein n=1 Tax=Vibrio phage vB_VpaP_G1 TaxID=2862773 RepID=A0AAE8BMA6_9CAUD|nr:recombinase [Vibrio phage vB_VpaP_G1]QYW05816.1 putative outer capsid protein [Vibrio phage vB_VpaP_G1]
MILANVPSLMNINGGEELRRKALRLQNLVAVNSTYSNNLFEQVVLFWEDQKARLTEKSGTPYDGLFLGLAVPDVRSNCYKCLSDIRIHRSADKESAWTAFCDAMVKAAKDSGNGGETPDEVVITVGKSEVYLAPKDHNYASNAMEVLNAQGNPPVDFFNAEVTYSVTPAGTEVVFDSTGLPEAVGTAVESGGKIVIRSNGVGTGVFKIKAGGKEASITLNVVDKGLTTASIGTMTVGGSKELLLEEFITPYQEGAQNLRVMLKNNETSLSLAGTTLTAVESGFQRVYGLAEWPDAPGLVFADSSGVDINDPEAPTSAPKNGVE